MRSNFWQAAILLGLLGQVVTIRTAAAEGPAFSLIPFKRIEADPNKDYELTEDHGPWMILASSFAGERAEKQAKQLVLELRRDYKLPAYVHRKRFDFSQPVQGIGVNRYGELKKMRHFHDSSFDEIAVLVGNYPALDDPGLQKSLQRIKFAQPECLDLKKTKGTSQRMGQLRHLYRLVSSDDDHKSRGPMGNAFATRNPLLPDDEAGVRTIDPLVVEMNKNVEYSLFKNKGKYTVKVATFGGVNTWMKTEIEQFERTGRGKLEEAAYKANKLTEALRAQGVEAWEFHDLHESIVCVGSFESVGEPRDDGKIEIDPRVHSVIKKYGAEQKSIPGLPTVGMQPKSLGGIRFDVQPIPVEVPRPSIGAKYSRKLID